jgi:hypothetical protein
VAPLLGPDADQALPFAVALELSPNRPTNAEPDVFDERHASTYALQYVLEGRGEVSQPCKPLGLYLWAVQTLANTRYAGAWCSCNSMAVGLVMQHPVNLHRTPGAMSSQWSRHSGVGAGQPARRLLEGLHIVPLCCNAQQV